MGLNFTGKPSLVAYVTCGDPDLRTTREVALAAIAAGAEVIELGVPFSDPVADGPVIQRASVAKWGIAGASSQAGGRNKMGEPDGTDCVLLSESGAADGAGEVCRAC